MVEGELLGHARVLRWKGSTDGIRWVAESLYGKSSHSSRNRQHINVTRWRTEGMYGGATNTLFMGLPEGTTVPKGQEAEGMLMQLAVKAALFALDKGIDLHFGKEIGAEVDAQELKRVDDAETQLPGFAIMSTVPSDATRIVFQGVGQAISANTNRGRRPWVLIWKRGVAVADIGAAQSAAELEPIVKAGVAIARVPR